MFPFKKDNNPEHTTRATIEADLCVRVTPSSDLNPIENPENDLKKKFTVIPHNLDTQVDLIYYPSDFWKFI